MMHDQRNIKNKMA